MCVYKVLAIFCFLHLVFGVEFSHARPLYTRQEVKAGSKLVIPCVITTDLSASSVGLEWGMTPEGGGPYTPILQREIVNLQKHQGKRFHLHLIRSEEEDCSLVISPVLQSDSGIYEVRFTVDNVQRHPFKKVIIHVTDSTLEVADTEMVKKHHGNLDKPSETPSVTGTGVSRISPPTTETSNYGSGIVYTDSTPPSVTDTEGSRMSQATITKTSDYEYYDSGSQDRDSVTHSVTGTEVPAVSPPTVTETSDYDSGSLHIESAAPSVTGTEGPGVSPATITETSDYEYYDSGSQDRDSVTHSVTGTKGPSVSPPTGTETSDYDSGSLDIDSAAPSVTDTEGPGVSPETIPKTSSYEYYDSGSVTHSVTGTEGSRMLPGMTETSDYDSGSLDIDSATPSVTDTEGSRMLPAMTETSDYNSGSLDIESAAPSVTDTEGPGVSPATITKTSAYEYYDSGSVTHSVTGTEGSRMLPATTETSDYDSGSLDIDSVAPSVTGTEGSRMLPGMTETSDHGLRSLDISSAIPSVTATEGFGISPPMTTESSTYKSGIPVISPDVKYIVSMFFQMKKNGLFLLLATMGGLFFIMLIVAITAVCFLGIQDCGDRFKVMDKLKRLRSKEQLSRQANEEELSEIVVEAASSGSVITP